MLPRHNHISPTELAGNNAMARVIARAMLLLFPRIRSHHFDWTRK